MSLWNSIPSPLVSPEQGCSRYGPRLVEFAVPFDSCLTTACQLLIKHIISTQHDLAGNSQNTLAAIAMRTGELQAWNAMMRRGRQHLHSGSRPTTSSGRRSMTEAQYRPGTLLRLFYPLGASIIWQCLGCVSGRAVTLWGLGPRCMLPPPLPHTHTHQQQHAPLATNPPIPQGTCCSTSVLATPVPTA